MSSNKNQKTLCYANKKSGMTKSLKQQEEAISMNIDSNKSKKPKIKIRH